MYATCARLGSRAFAPAGAALTITSLSVVSASEKTTAQASNRLVSKSLNRLVCYQQRLLSSEASKAGESVGKDLPKAAAPKQGFSFLQWYEGHLQARPIPTKMVTGAFLWGLGDAVAQFVPNWAAGKPMPDYDWPRTGRAAFFGFAIHAPLSHLHFNFLEWMTVRGGFQGLQIPIFKAFMEQFVYWSWFSNSLYHGAMGAMQGQNLEQIYNRIADVLWETQIAQWKFWIPIQLLNFRFVPVRHQLNVVLITSIAWTALLSAWYPPEDSKEEPEKFEHKMHVLEGAVHD